MKTLKVLVILILISYLSEGIARADFTFGEPTKVANINSSSYDTMPYISADGLELYFLSNRPHGGDLCYSDIWVSRRSTIGDSWSEPLRLDPPANTDGPEGSPCISSDGLELYFTNCWFPLYEGTGCEPSPGGYGEGDLWVSRRATKQDPWGEPENLGQTVNSPDTEDTPSISPDGLSLYFMSDRGGGINIFVTKRQTKDDPWGPAMNLGYPINSDYYESVPRISPDGLSLFFSVGGYSTDIYVSRRPTTIDPWASEVSFDPVNSTSNEYALTYAAGCSTLYFARGDNYFDTGTYDIWQVEVSPIVDLNGDGKVNRLDMGLLMVNWGTDDSLYDIGPAPFGDGIVDSKDLMVLAENGAMLAGDANYDGVVDFFDLAELAKNWLRQEP
jgi:hypothetical protein